MPPLDKNPAFAPGTMRLGSYTTVPPSDPNVPLLIIGQIHDMVGLYSVTERKNFSIIGPRPEEEEEDTDLDEHNMIIYLPQQLEWAGCLNSCRSGWLMLFDKLSNLHLREPFSGRDISLPPLSTFPGIYTSCELCCIHGCCRHSHGGVPNITHYHFTKWNGRRAKRRADLAGMAYVKRAVVGWTGTDSYTVLAIYGGRRVRRLAFARSGDTEWTDIPGFTKVRDIMYREDDHCFLALEHDGSLKKLGMDGSLAPMLVDTMASQTPFKRPPCCIRRYLAQLPGYRVLQVLKIAESCPLYFNTRRFEVYELADRWLRVEQDLGGYSLFVGRNETIAVSTRDSPAVLPNCIYFNDDFYQFRDSVGTKLKDSGIFHLEDRSFETYYPNPYNFTWPRAIWFRPSPPPPPQQPTDAAADLEGLDRKRKDDSEQGEKGKKEEEDRSKRRKVEGKELGLQPKSSTA